MISKKTSLLYVDDEKINLILFEKLFNDNDKINIITANSGIDALNILNQHPEIKLIFSDMKMPKMNGIEFIKQAKTSYTNKYYYIITGYNLNKEIEEALTTGLIANYYRKPFDIKLIKETINDSI